VAQELLVHGHTKAKDHAPNDFPPLLQHPLRKSKSKYVDMQNFAASAGKKLFERNLQQYQPADPLYETYIDKKGRERRRKVSTRKYFYWRVLKLE
jgi:hypothetical protein